VQTPWVPSTYGDRFAPVYDEWYDDDVTTAVDTLAALADGGPVLELGVGTGRLAVPLATRGLAVDGIDASAAMVERLREKPGGGAVGTVVVGDMADVGALAEHGRYGLVFVASSTLCNLDTLEAQARCVAGAAKVLRPGGRLVVEAFVPDLDRLSQPDVVTVRSIEPDRVLLFASKADLDTQRLDTAIVELVDGSAGVRVFPARLRWVSPGELDLIATEAGLDLEARWSGWDRRPCDETSGSHVSVWRRIHDLTRASGPQ
jgi:SAM-dependent methyltransferase